MKPSLRKLTLLLGISAALHDFTSASHPVPLDKSARIAIVGGGVSGVSAAETFVKSGYSNVVVFESGSSVVPLSHAVKTRDAVYDLDLVYVPALSWTGAGVEKRYDEVLREYASDLIPVSEFVNHTREPLNLNESTRSDGGHRKLKLQNYIDIKLSKDDGLQFFQEIQQFYHEHGSFFERHQYDGIPACLAKGFAKPDETFQQWMLRHRLPQLFARASVLLDLYGNFPVGSSPACQVLMILANKMPSILAPGLLLTSLQEDYPKWLAASEYGPLPEAMKSWATQLAGTVPPFMHRFRYGYGSLFASVVAKNRIGYRTKSRVHEIVPQVDVETGKRSLRLDIVGQASVEADVVVVAGRPDQIHRALPEDHPMTPLYAEVAAHAENVTREFGVYGVAVMSFEIAEDAGMLSGKRFVIDHQRHQLPMILDRLPAEVSVMRATKTADAKILTVTFQTTYALAGRSRERDLLRAELELYGFTNLSVLRLQHYPNTPTRVPLAAVAAGWYDKAEKAQGQQGIYFVGETFSGHGVPTTFLHTRDWCVRTFNLSFSAAFSPPSAPLMAWIAALAVVPSVSPTTLLLGVLAAALAAKLLEKRASHAKKE